MCIHLSPCEIKVTNCVERLREEVREREMVCTKRGGGKERERWLCVNGRAVSQAEGGHSACQIQIGGEC